MRERNNIFSHVILNAVPMLTNGTESPPKADACLSADTAPLVQKHAVCVVRDTLRLRSQKALTALRVTGLITLIFFVGCNDMYDGSRIKPLEKDAFFANGSSARPLPEGTVARGEAVNDDLLHTGKIDGKLADAFPFAITDSVMKRGQNRFTTFCTPCHGRLGDGGGMIVQRGFPQPNSFHADSVRLKPAGHYFDVMTNGFGKMFSYNASVPLYDRWAIVAYIRALQLSQRASAAALSDKDKQKLSELSK